ILCIMVLGHLKSILCIMVLGHLLSEQQPKFQLLNVQLLDRDNCPLGSCPCWEIWP
ncbi:hypothetical protein SK128_007901, partial [Halocaridina rubra]